MEYITLNNGVKMPLLGFGTFLVSGKQCEKAVIQKIAELRALDKANPVIGDAENPEKTEIAMTW